MRVSTDPPHPPIQFAPLNLGHNQIVLIEPMQCVLEFWSALPTDTSPTHVTLFNVTETPIRWNSDDPALAFHSSASARIHRHQT